MQIKRRFTTAGKSPYEKIPFRRATSEIKNPDGSVVFKLENFAVYAVVYAVYFFPWRLLRRPTAEPIAA